MEKVRYSRRKFARYGESSIDIYGYFLTDYIAKALILLRKMSVQEVETEKISPAARYTKAGT